MIDLDFERFMTGGYLILRGVIAPEQLEPLRQSAEEAFRRRFPEGVPGGVFQPWAMNFNDVTDEATANWVEIFMHESLPALPLTALTGEAGSYCAPPLGRPAPPDLPVVAEFDLYFGYQRGSYRLA